MPQESKTNISHAAKRDHPLGKIVVATDFSPGADNALRWACGLAALHEAEIVLVHVIQPPPFFDRPLFSEEMTEAAKRGFWASERTCASVGIRCTTSIRIGKPWEELDAAVADAGADLIIVGSRGLSDFSRTMLGSVADRTIRTAAAPVVTVHPEDRFAAPFETILIATDFSEEAALATSSGVRLLDGAGARGRIILLHACMPAIVFAEVAPSGMPAMTVAGPDNKDVEAEAKRTLDTLAAEISSSTISVEVRCVTEYAVDAILEEAERSGADLIALGTRGRSGLNRFLMGSIAERVVHHATCPVLTAHHTQKDGSMQVSGR